MAEPWQSCKKTAKDLIKHLGQGFGTIKNRRLKLALELNKPLVTVYCMKEDLQ
jgi:hypothetical protein